jgi:hypothetical protein
LGSLLLATESGKAETRLQKDDFESAKYGRIYETIINQWNAGTTPTIITLCRDLAPDIPASEIAELTNKVPSAANITYYENAIFEASKTRFFLRALQTAKEEIDQHTDTDTVIKNFIPALAALTTARNEAGIKTAAELLNMQFPEIRWIVIGLIGEGLILICGAPKIGKSWFVLNLAIATAAGGGFLGTLNAEQTDTLYIALEDNYRRLNNRLKKLKAPESRNLKITTQWRDGYSGLENYLKENRGIGLVIIDTLARFANIDDMNDYSMTTNAMARLKRIADDLNITIVLIHHTKKTGRGNSGADWMEAALGSTGLTGATDSTIYISRGRKEGEIKNTATLYATGRDTADTIKHLKLDIDCGGWTITDEPHNPAPKPKKQKVYGTT